MKYIFRALNLLRAFFINSGLVLLSCIFSLVLLEQGFRLWVFGWDAFDRELMRNNVKLALSSVAEASPYPEIYWALKPNLDTTLNFARFQTNEYGLADQSYSRDKSENVYRIAILGDSYTMPLGVDTDKAYHALMERQLNRLPQSPNQKKYELINFGIGGFNLQRYNAVLKQLLPAWQPDAILIGYCGFNDHIKINVNAEAVWQQAFVADGFLKSYVIDLINLYKQDKKIAQRFAELELINSQNINFIEQEFSQLRENADAIRPNMPILLAYLDNREHHPNNIAQIAALAEKYNMYFVDTTQRFHGTKLADFSLHILDSHPNARANEIFAEQLLAAIKSNGWFGVSAH